LSHPSRNAECENRNRTCYLARFRSSSFDVGYSPAHCEEIANIYRSQQDEKLADQHVNEHLNVITAITENVEILPAYGHDGPERILPENPNICLDRCIAEYEKTLNSEQSNEYVMSMKGEQHRDAVREKFGLDASVPKVVKLQQDALRPSMAQIVIFASA